MKKAGKILLITFITFFGLFLTGVIVVAIKSPGKLDPMKGGNGKIIDGSIAEKNAIETGGMRQGFFIRAENPENPVLLFLHGGPGSPELPYSVAYETTERLEKYFTVCYWEQRGAGMSFNKSIDVASMNVNQFVEDARQMTEYLKDRFKQDKIYLMGHSWGSYLGIKTIEKYPQNYLAFIGIGQISAQLESEKLAYDFLLNHPDLINDKKTSDKLKQYDKNDPDFPHIDYIMASRGLLNKYGVGLARQNISMANLMSKVLFFKGYTLSEKLNYFRGSLFSLVLFDNAMKDNLFESSVTFDAPIFFIQGKHDYMTSYVLALDYLNRIDAPLKAFFTFDHSAHSPNLEEPEKFIKIVRDILQTKIIL